LLLLLLLWLLLLLLLLLFWLLSFARVYRHRAARALALVARPIQALALEAAVASRRLGAAVGAPRAHTRFVAAVQ